MQNIHGENVVIGEPIHKGTDWRVKYRNTPVADKNAIPAGRSMHIGDGVFRTMCAGGCGMYADKYTGGYWIPELRHHEYNDHGLDVVGVNVGMLS